MIARLRSAMLRLLAARARRRGDHPLAAARLRTALALDPRDAAAWAALGRALRELGLMQEAEQAFGSALSLAPGDAGTLVERAITLYVLARLEESERCLAEAVAIDPENAIAHHNLGVARHALGRTGEAAENFHLAAALDPQSAEAHFNLGNALRDLGRAAEAERSYREALARAPGHADARNNLGAVLLDLERLDEAEQCYREALKLRPDFAEAYSNLGNVLCAAARLEEAIACYRRALALNPGFAGTHSNLIFALDLDDRASVAEQQRERRRWYEAHGAPLAGTLRPHDNDRDPERRLRIGYVSADFQQHSAFFVFFPVLRSHERGGFEIACYSQARREDAQTALVRGTADLWRRTAGLDDDALERQIRSDRIDILVDLSGHSGGNRLAVFARKPAPVQVTAWGYATGTGLATMDYFLADPVHVLPEMRAHFAERIFDLPCWGCYEAPSYAPAVAPLPALGGRPFSFGCINRVQKITDRVLALWARALDQVPGALLQFKSAELDEPQLREHFLERLRRSGLAAQRVRLFGSSPHAEHLRIYGEIDVALDPFPQCGGVSTAEALWMGVPVVTRPGTTPTSRASAAFLTVLGMQDWIAGSEEDYVRLAVAASGDLPRLARLRAELRSRFAGSIIGDARRYTAAVEAAYRAMWRRWCAQTPLSRY